MQKLNIMLLPLLFSSCASTNSQKYMSNDDLITLIGVFVSGEYAYFETSNGEYYSLSIEREEDQQRLAKLSPLRIDGASTCLKMKILGRLEKFNGYLNRKLISVVRVIEADQTPCEK